MSKDVYYGVELTAYTNAARTSRLPESKFSAGAGGSFYGLLPYHIFPEEIHATPETHTGVGEHLVEALMVFTVDGIRVYPNQSTGAVPNGTTPISFDMTYAEIFTGKSGFRSDAERAEITVFRKPSEGETDEFPSPVDVLVRRTAVEPKQVPVLKIDARYEGFTGSYSATMRRSHYHADQPAVMGGLNALWLGNGVVIDSLPEELRTTIVEKGFRFENDIMRAFFALEDEGIEVYYGSTMESIGIVSWEHLKARALHIVSARAVVDPHTTEDDGRQMHVWVSLEMAPEKK